MIFGATILHHLLTIYSFAHSFGQGRGIKQCNWFQSFKCSIFCPSRLGLNFVGPVRMTASGKLKTRTMVKLISTQKKWSIPEKLHYLPSANSPNKTKTAFRHPDTLTGTYGDLYAEICSLTLVISPVSGLYAKRGKKKKKERSLHLSGADLLT